MGDNMRGLKLKGFKKITKNKNIITFDKPNYVYIPLICSNNTDFDISVKIGDDVKIGSILATNTKFDMPIYATISGKIVGFEEKYCYTGELINTIKIENDFKEEYENKIEKDINKYSKKEFIDLLKRLNIRGMGGADFPTYIKYDTKKRIKNLVINAVECEPYITADYRIMKEHINEILSAIEAIMNINKIDKGFIVIKKNNNEIIKLLNKNISIYPNIKIVKVPNIYPMGWEKYVVKNAIHKDYDKLPIEVDTIVNNVSTVYSIYEALKYEKPVISRLVTVVGDGIKKSCNIDIKIGTNMVDVFESLGYKKGELIFISGGPMMGKAIPDDDFIITSNVNNILILKKIDEDISSTCLRCGKCTAVCPAKLSPILIKENISNIEELKKLNVEKCIECGLCSYICPAKILLREHVKRAKKNVRDAK